MNNSATSTRHLGNMRRDDIVAFRPAAVNVEGKPPKLQRPIVGRVVRVDADAVSVRECETEHAETIVHDIRATQILFNLGATPSDMTIFGFNTAALFQKTVELPAFGPVHWLFKTEDEKLRKRVHYAFETFAKWLKTNGLVNVLDLNLVVEVRPKRGKYAGYYRPSKNLADKAGVLAVIPESCANASLDSMLYVVAHEFGHVLKSQLLHDQPHILAKWLALYHATVRATTPTPETCRKMFDLMRASPDFPSWKNACREDDDLQAAFKLCGAFWRKTARLSAHDVDVLLRAEKHQALLKIQPSAQQLADASLRPVISEYACKNVHEMFAEAFAFHVEGRELPDNIVAAIDQSLTAARAALRRQ